MPNVMDLLDIAGRLRYGVPTSEKEAAARRGDLPGAPVDNTADQARADRYAAGYLFGKAHPTIAAAVMPIVSQLKTSDLPVLGGSSPELQSYALQGAQRGIQDAQPRAADLLSQMFAPKPQPSQPTPAQPPQSPATQNVMSLLGSAGVK